MIGMNVLKIPQETKIPTNIFIIWFRGKIFPRWDQNKKFP